MKMQQLLCFLLLLHLLVHFFRSSQSCSSRVDWPGAKAAARKHTASDLWERWRHLHLFAVQWDAETSNNFTSLLQLLTLDKHRVSCLCKMHFFPAGQTFYTVFLSRCIAHCDHMSLAINVFGRIDWDEEQLNKTAAAAAAAKGRENTFLTSEMFLLSCLHSLWCMRLFLLALLHQVTCLPVGGKETMRSERTIELPLFHQG